ncbi:MAG TPA: hypothetical protein VIU41_14665 [Geobacteraceae bacterium]
MKTFRRVLTLAVSVLLVSLATDPCHAKELGKTHSRFSIAGITKEQEMTSFFAKFQVAVARRDRNKVAAMVHFPLEVTLATGSRRKMTGRDEFLAQFDNIFDQKFSATIAGMREESLLANGSGVATPLGEVWFQKKGKGASRAIRVVKINGVVRQ